MEPPHIGRRQRDRFNMGDMQSAQINSMRGNQGAGRERRVRNSPGDKSIEREVKGRETGCSAWATVKHSIPQNKEHP